MTQAVNNLNILQNTIVAVDTQTAGKFADVKTTDDKSIDFDSILDKTVENESETTLGDIKKVDLNWDMSEQMEAFKEFLLQTTQEVSVEKSLDLTLARDITEIINQLQSAVNIDLTAEETEIEVQEEDETDTEIPQPVFEQVLTYLNTNVPLNSNENPDLQNNENQNYKTSDNEICKTLFKPKETLDTDITKNLEDNTLDIDNEMLKELNIESLSSEADASGNSYNLNQQSPEELGLKVMLNRDVEKFDISTSDKTISNAEKPVGVTSENIVEQIAKHIEALKTTSKLNMVLNPETLGKVNLQILTTKDGLSAQFTVATNEVRELLMKGLDGLKETLLAQGVAVDNISVKVSETEEAYNPDWTEQESEGGNKEQRQQKQEEKEKGLFEKTIAQSLKEDNGNV